MRIHRWALAAPALAGAIFGAPARATGFWTPEAIVEAPRVTQTAISADGAVAAYLVRRDHVDGNYRDSTLVQIDVQTRVSQSLLTAKLISDLSSIPGDQRSWSVLADIGQGVQLYRVTPEGAVSMLSKGKRLVTVGGPAAEAVMPSLQEPAQAFGIMAYGWAPDGRAYWYASAEAVEAPARTAEVLNDPRVPLVSYHANRSELHVVDMVTGRDLTLATANGGTQWPLIFYGDGAGKWSRNSEGHLVLNYRVMEDSVPTTASDRQFDLQTSASVPGRIGAEPGGEGPGGGILAVEGPWQDRHLVETLPDHSRRDFGPVQFTINSGWNPGIWRLNGHDETIVAVRRDGENVRNSLIKIDKNGDLSELEQAISLDNCAFSETATVGVCVREGLATPPSLVAIDGLAWTQRPLTDVDPRYGEITPLTYFPKVWRAKGHSASGFVSLPRGYVPGRRYPALILTHGYDADNSFVNTSFQWSYPAQVFAERGYVLVYINDIPMRESPTRVEAYNQWNSGVGKLPGHRVQDIVWLDQLSIYRQALDELIGAGIVDPSRVGIAGYSRGSQMANVAVTQTNWFRASASGDGSYFAPSGYWMGDNATIYGMLFGGPPYDRQWQHNWARIAPAFRADKTGTAVLFQNAAFATGMVDFYQALRSANVPAAYVSYPGETHLPNAPANRLRIMTESLDWFDFWLRGIEHPESGKADQYLLWRQMRRTDDQGTKTDQGVHMPQAGCTKGCSLECGGYSRLLFDTSRRPVPPPGLGFCQL